MSVDLVVGTPTPTSMNINDNGTLGTPVSLPLATSSDAGLMSDADKTKVDNSIQQDGNSFGTDMTIGTNDSQIVNIKTQGSTRMYVQNLWIGLNRPLRNGITQDNSVVNLSATGTVISRNVADPNPALDVNLANTSSTAAIQRWQQGGSLRAFVNSAGSGTFGRLFAGPALTQPNYLLDINAGTVAGANILASFSQNTGSIRLENGTGQPSNFAPTIRGTAKGAFPWGILMQGQGGSSYDFAGVVLRACDSSGTGPVTAGNTFQLENNTTSQLSIDYTGVVNIPNLAGTGTRIATADSSGSLGSVSVVPIANGGTGLTNAGSNGQILVSDGTNFVLTTPTPQFIKNNYPFPYLIPDSSVTENSGINTNGGFGTGPIVYQFAAMAGYVVTEVDYMIVFIGDSLVYLPNPEDWVGRILELKLNPSAGNPSATCYLTGGNPSITYPVYDGLVQINSFEAKQGARIKIQAAYSDAVSLFCWEIMDMNVW